MSLHVFTIHGPNLNLLGEREPETYGSTTLDELNEMLVQRGRERGVKMRIFQSNSEGSIIDAIHEGRIWTDGILINPGALTHYSYSLRDALAAVAKPAIEVHLSDIYNRESFRKISVIKDICIDQVYGHGIESYIIGLERLITHLENRSTHE